MKTIELTQGLSAWVDDDDYDKVAAFKWHAHVHSNHWTARCNNYGRFPTGSRVVGMHRFIMGFPASRIDHKNGNSLDNRKLNLRVCNQSQNGANAKKKASNKSGFKGVSWDSERNKWVVFIYKDYKHIYLGRYSEIAQAASAYEAAAKKLFGEFARP